MVKHAWFFICWIHGFEFIPCYNFAFYCWFDGSANFFLGCVQIIFISWIFFFLRASYPFQIVCLFFYRFLLLVLVFVWLFASLFLFENHFNFSFTGFLSLSICFLLLFTQSRTNAAKIGPRKGGIGSIISLKKCMQFYTYVAVFINRIRFFLSSL